MKTLFAALLCFVSIAAFAADTKPVPNDLGITDKDCQQLVDYHPSGDVDYKPGVDVHGKPLVEADLNPSVVTVPTKFSFDLTVDAAHYLGVSVPAGSQGLMKVGTVTVDNGQVTFNGKPMEGDAMAALKAACASKPAEKAPLQQQNILHTPKNILNPGQ